MCVFDEGIPELCEYDFKYAIQTFKNIPQIFNIQSWCKTDFSCTFLAYFTYFSIDWGFWWQFIRPLCNICNIIFIFNEPYWHRFYTSGLARKKISYKKIAEKTQSLFYIFDISIKVIIIFANPQSKKRVSTDKTCPVTEVTLQILQHETCYPHNLSGGCDCLHGISHKPHHLQLRGSQKD